MDSFDEQFAGIVRRWQGRAQALLCDGDARSAMIWDPQSQITIRLRLTGDEVWVVAGSGTLVRFVSASDGEFDHDGIDHVISRILAGEAIEYFGAAGREGDDVFATSYRIGEEPLAFTGGLNQRQSQFLARIAGPMAVGRLDRLE